MDRFNKMNIAMRFRLLGMANIDSKFQVACDAFDFVEKLFKGEVRKDGKTPVFMHPLEVLAYLVTMLPSLRHPAETLATALLHDAMEDKGLTEAECAERFGARITHATRRLSKPEGAKGNSLERYFHEMLDCPIATVVKGSDRINNQSTMTGVFSLDKQLSYVWETEQHILPMLKKARRLYSDQESVYENMKLVLRNQALLVRATQPGA